MGVALNHPFFNIFEWDVPLQTIGVPHGYGNKGGKVAFRKSQKLPRRLSNSTETGGNASDVMYSSRKIHFHS